MLKRKFIIAGLVAVALLITGIASIYKSHPIFLKWMIGQASIVGKPIEAKVYTDGKLNEAIKVFSVEKTTDGKTSKYLLIDFANAATDHFKNIICVHRSAKYLGQPIGTTKKDFDYINGVLFQSEVGGIFVPYNSVKIAFDPTLADTGGKITFKLSKSDGQFKCDSVRVEL